MQHDHLRTIFFDTLRTPAAPKSHPLGMAQASEHDPVLYLLFVRTHIKFSLKIFEIDFVIEI